MQQHRAYLEVSKETILEQRKEIESLYSTVGDLKHKNEELSIKLKNKEAKKDMTRAEFEQFIDKASDKSELTAAQKNALLKVMSEIEAEAADYVRSNKEAFQRDLRTFQERLASNNREKERLLRALNELQVEASTRNNMIETLKLKLLKAGQTLPDFEFPDIGHKSGAAF